MILIPYLSDTNKEYKHQRFGLNYDIPTSLWVYW